jgi:intracellular multiplication protein IcmK
MKYRQAIVHIVSLLLSLTATVAFAENTAAGDNQSSQSVAKFQQWLSARDQDSQAQLQAEVPRERVSVDTANAGDGSINDAAFQATLDGAMPMTPDQIKQFKAMMQETQRAAATDVGAPPKPVSSTIIVNMAPGATPPAIRMYQGFITSMVFMDSSGASWPIANYDLGNATAFNVQWDKESNVLMIQPLQPYTYANLAIRLKGMSTPVMLTLVPGQSQVDYRVDLRVNGLGPNATAANVGGTMPSHSDPTLLSVLDGIPPSGSKKLKINEQVGQVWLVGSTQYLRTRFTVLSPGWINKLTSPDGMHAYKMTKTPNVLLSEYGKTVLEKIEEA